jgi:hypothetical protein
MQPQRKRLAHAREYRLRALASVFVQSEFVLRPEFVLRQSLGRALGLAGSRLIAVGDPSSVRPRRADRHAAAAEVVAAKLCGAFCEPARREEVSERVYAGVIAPPCAEPDFDRVLFQR